jgi:hypothetical protein
VLTLVGNELNVVLGKTAPEHSHRQAGRISGAMNAEKELDLSPIVLLAE